MAEYRRGPLVRIGGLSRLLRAVGNRMPTLTKLRRNAWLRRYHIRNQAEREYMFMSIARFQNINRPIPGYYFEFGCHSANTMRMAWNNFQWLFDFTYVAFDSFEGLPEIAAIDHQAIWEKGKLKTDEDEFVRICTRHGIPRNRLITIRGFYDRSLNAALAAKLLPKKAAVIYIDCDLYESTVPVLRFVRDFLQVGTIIVFDDWNCFHADPERGERRAFTEFCLANPELRFEKFVATDMQQAFVVIAANGRTHRSNLA